jgi:hypothetical protein
LSEVFLLILTINAKLPMLSPTFPQEPDAAGNRDRHAGTDATGKSMDVLSPEPVPTRFSAWRSFPRKRRPKNRSIDGGPVEIERPVFHRIRNPYDKAI